MDAYFVRVYHTADGNKQEVNAIYESYTEAEQNLGNYISISDVVYAAIEKRFSPTPIW